MATPGGALVRQNTLEGDDMIVDTEAGHGAGDEVPEGAFLIPHMPIRDGQGEATRFALRVTCSAETDIGGMRENQDDVYVWQAPANRGLVLCVFDGHGREVGKVAANAARAFLETWLEEHFAQLLGDDAVAAFQSMFAGANHAVKSQFQRHYEERGEEIEEAPEGFLLKRRRNYGPWLCVFGGSSFSCVCVLQDKILTANVGDSSALLAATHGSLRPAGKFRVADLAAGVETNGRVAADVIVEDNDRVIMITADHSPESIDEFNRMKTSHPSRDGGHKPRMQMVYDNIGPDKSNCPQIFQLSSEGSPTVTSNGRYWKNVRQEWACLVATPPYARFHDALAFTRSLGDLHLQSYGVSHMPEVYEFSLVDMAEAVMEGRVGQDRAGLAIVAASDGIWDNWVFSDCMAYVLDSGGFDGGLTPVGNQQANRRLMAENKRRAFANFGNQADNATCALAFLEIVPAES